jgi:DNA-binding transcriptional regulator YiaG
MDCGYHGFLGSEALYHYIESGLQNIYLANGYKVFNDEDGESVSIASADELHTAIGRWLACKPYLTGAELRFLRKELGLSQHRLGEMLGSSEQTVSLWERRGRMPKGLDRLVKLLYLEMLDGNVNVQNLINRLIELDERQQEDLIFEDTDSGWKKAA